jgi:pyruvate,water dikinase
LQKYLCEVSRRVGLHHSDDLFFLLPSEIVSFLRKDELADTKVIEERKKGYVMWGDGKSTRVYVGPVVSIAKEKIQFLDAHSESKDILGQVAYPGITKGVVCLMRSKEDFVNMIEGGILVSHSTTPDYVPVIKQAGAIITDEGGVLSHASVISREMKIPCIIGTKIATQVLHDGDLVEVDADAGVVRVLERSVVE